MNYGTYEMIVDNLNSINPKLAKGFVAEVNRVAPDMAGASFQNKLADAKEAMVGKVQAFLSSPVLKPDPEDILLPDYHPNAVAWAVAELVRNVNKS